MTQKQPADASETARVRTKVGPRGRITIPAALQRAAGVAEGDEVVIRVVSPGVLAVETTQVVLDRIRSGVPADWTSSEAEADE